MTTDERAGIVEEIGHRRQRLTSDILYLRILEAQVAVFERLPVPGHLLLRVADLRYEITLNTYCIESGKARYLQSFKQKLELLHAALNTELVQDLQVIKNFVEEEFSFIASL